VKNIILLLTVLFLGCSSPKETLNGDYTSTKNSDSQGYFPPKELVWVNCDSTTCDPSFYINYEPFVIDSNQINKWIDYSLFGQEFYRIRNCNVCISITDMCSGLPCPIIHIIKDINKHWQLIRETSLRTTHNIIKIKVDYEQEKILFKIDTTQIGELPFDIFDKYSDQSK
jgi:hypothetical protein